MICPNCGVLLPEDVKQCGKCGHQLDKDLGKTIVEGEVGGIIDLDKTVVEEVELPKTVIFQSDKEKPLYGWLVIIEGEGQWREFRIPDEEKQFLIGKDESCYIRLSDPTIERFHASLRIKNGKLIITDLDTDGKTLLEDKVVIKEEIPDGSIIQIGQTKLKFRKF